METFYQGATVKWRLLVKDSAGTLTDPSSGCTITVTDPSGTVSVNDQAMTKDATGTYSYHQALAADATVGDWKGKYKANNTHISIAIDRIRVVAY